MVTSPKKGKKKKKHIINIAKYNSYHQTKSSGYITSLLKNFYHTTPSYIFDSIRLYWCKFEIVLWHGTVGPRIFRLELSIVKKFHSNYHDILYEPLRILKSSFIRLSWIVSALPFVGT